MSRGVTLRVGSAREAPRAEPKHSAKTRGASKGAKRGTYVWTASDCQVPWAIMELRSTPYAAQAWAAPWPRPWRVYRDAWGRPTPRRASRRVEVSLRVVSGTPGLARKAGASGEEGSCHNALYHAAMRQYGEPGMERTKRATA